MTHSPRWQRLLRSARRDPVTAGALIVLLVIVAVAIFGGVLAPYNPSTQSRLLRLQPPSAQHWFGLDNLGRDLFSRVLVGARYSLTVGFTSIAIGLVFGTTLGMIAAYAGGFIDDLITRLLDILMSFPSVLLAVVILAVLGPGLTNVMLAVGIWSIPMFARLVRSSVLSLRELEYVTAARALGASSARIMFRHLLPQLSATLIVLCTIRLSTAILSTAALSFLGLGAPGSIPEWGTMLSEGKSYMRTAPHLVLFPGIAIMLTALVLNVLGDALRDGLDPSLRE